MGRRLPRVLSEQELRSLLDAVNWDSTTGLRNRLALELMAYCGLRVSEVANLKPGDLDLENRRLIVRNGKGGKDRVLPLRTATITALRRWRRERHQQATYLLHTIKGGKHKQMSRSSLLKMVKHYARLAGLNTDRLGCHTLRHTCATMLRRAGVDLVIIQGILGHEHLSTTGIYQHVAPVEVEQAIQKLDRDEQLDAAVRGMDDQQSLEGQPDALGLLIGQLVTSLPAEEKSRIAQALLKSVGEEQELVSVE